MRFIFSVVFAVLTAASVQAQSQEDLQKQISSLQERLAKFSTSETYTAGAAQAVATGRPLVTFLGTTPRAVVGAVVARSETLTGYDAPAVVISLPGEGWLTWRATLPATATDADIQAAIAPRAVQALPAPFSGRVPAADDDWTASVEALDEVNQLRARHGLRPFIRDDGLTRAAHSASIFRARRQMAGHCPNDFAYVPTDQPTRATAAGCAAWEPSLGWGSCCDGVHTSDGGATHAGAAWAWGPDQKRYMHIFVR